MGTSTTVVPYGVNLQYIQVKYRYLVSDNNGTHNTSALSVLVPASHDHYLKQNNTGIFVSGMQYLAVLCPVAVMLLITKVSGRRENFWCNNSFLSDEDHNLQSSVSIGMSFRTFNIF